MKQITQVEIKKEDHGNKRDLGSRAHKRAVGYGNIA